MLGLQVKRLLPEESFEQKAHALGAHRDDHYVFLLLSAGSGFLTVDLQEVRLAARQLFYVIPGQVHHHVRTRKAEGWFLAVDRSLMPAGCRNIFEGRPELQLPGTVGRSMLEEMDQLLTVLAARSAETVRDARLQTAVVHALLQAFLWMAAQVFEEACQPGQTPSRPVELCRQFRILLGENLRVLKSPSAYAAHLHVSTAYLNEAVRKVTGLSTGYWIKQEIVLEAKRLLYFSDLNVKQIAADLGFEDAAYFSRYFRRVAGIPAQAFRALHRK